MKEYFRNLVGDFIAMAWFAPPDSGTEKLLRLVISGGLIILGVYFLIQGYEQAYSGDGSFFRPDGDGDHYFFGMVGGFAWLAVLLANRLRVLAWAFVIFLAWWCYGTISDYLKEQYYVLGKDGCPACTGWAAELHLGVGAFGLCAFVFAAILGFKQTPDWQFFAGPALAFVWLFMLGGLG